MPKNKLQGTVFGLIMSYAMAIGMEVYNIAYKMGFHLADGGFSSMTNAVLPECQPHSFLPLPQRRSATGCFSAFSADNYPKLRILKSRLASLC